MAENAEGDLNSNLLHTPYHTGDPQLDTAIGQWLRWDKVGTWSARHPPSPPAPHPSYTVRPFASPPAARRALGETAPAAGRGSAESGVTTHLCLGCLLGPFKLRRNACSRFLLQRAKLQPPFLLRPPSQVYVISLKK